MQYTTRVRGAKNHLWQSTVLRSPRSLLESERLDTEKALSRVQAADKKGLVEYAEGGTLFLDEIADLPSSLQAKLLRVLQEKEIRRLGGAQNIKVDIRIISASNKNLSDEIKNGKFREDLYFRLNIVEIHLPPLLEIDPRIFRFWQIFL